MAVSLVNIKNGFKVGEPVLGPEHCACLLTHSLSHLNSTPTESFMFLFTSILSVIKARCGVVLGFFCVRRWTPVEILLRKNICKQ